MALRLRRDVQKASYYVWFLGAEEAKGLRGVNVINPVLPYLIERSQKQEPLKVTLQVSHKGIKIFQESSKHFIPHSAITSSIQRDDIVACVLLLYNPTTKCPIHVHAYRCDSETTAEALHQQLQILINRPDNQKRFTELESRLGLSQSTSSLSSSKQKRIPGRYENRFISTLSSDTGISTRESEGSEEHSISMSPKSPLPKPKGDLFDSLAAELRAKLNGNGPPLLLPPRDYDTVHRSKGNLAAIELRRCQNSMIVGSNNPATSTGTTATNTTNPTGTIQCSAKQVSSRGSSGIGSDLAPSPERQDDRTSSEEDNWSNEADNSIDALKATPAQHTLIKRYCDDINEDHHIKDSYLRDLPSKNNRPKPINRADIIDREWNREDEIRPKLIRPMHKNWDIENNRHRKIRVDIDNEPSPPPVPQRIANGYPSEDYEVHANKKENPYRHKFQRQHQPHHDVCYDDDYELEKEMTPEQRKQNLTDRQKYQKAYHNQKIEIRGVRKYNERKSPDNRQEIRSKQPLRHHYYPSPERERERERPRSADRYRTPVLIDDEEHFPQDYDRNPYKEPESLPYRESIEKMLKSPIMRYKSFDDAGYKPSTDLIDSSCTLNKMSDVRRSHFRNDENYPNNGYHDNIERSPSSYMPPSSLSSGRKHQSHHDMIQESGLKVSFKERFQEAKEKFRALEKVKYTPSSSSSPEQIPSSLSSKNFHDIQYNNSNNGSKDYIENVVDDDDLDDLDDEHERHISVNNWSDEERHRHHHHDLNRNPSRVASRNIRRNEKHSKDDVHHSHHHDIKPSPIVSSKSLSNLVKGYRHSYAEPIRPALPRSSGRVGLAAVNPF